MAKRKPRNVWFLVIALIVVFVGLPLALLILAPFSTVIGSEFSPNTFESRSFFYLRVPGTKVALTKRYLETSESFARTLVNDRWIVEHDPANPRWDLVSDNFTNYRSPDCDARHLTGELNRRNDKYEYYWSKWTDKFPQRARVLWPLVAEFSRQGMYVYLTELFEFTRGADGLTDDEYAVELENLASTLRQWRAEANAADTTPAESEDSGNQL